MATWTPPLTLVANTAENVNDLNAIFTSLQATLNGGLDETNVPNLTAAFTTYKRLVPRAVQHLNSATVAGTYLLNQSPFQAGSTATTTDFVTYLDPAIYNANARTTKLALRLVVFTNAVAPAVNYTLGLYPVATWGGASSASPFVATLGAVVAGSTAVVNTPPAAGPSTTIGTDFNFPAAGYYVLAVQTSGTSTAGAVVHLLGQLEMRQV
jgi:hypothetical protein